MVAFVPAFAPLFVTGPSEDKKPGSPCYNVFTYPFRPNHIHAVRPAKRYPWETTVPSTRSLRASVRHCSPTLLGSAPLSSHPQWSYSIHVRGQFICRILHLSQVPSAPRSVVFFTFAYRVHSIQLQEFWQTRSHICNPGVPHWPTSRPSVALCCFLVANSPIFSPRNPGDRGSISSLYCCLFQNGRCVGSYCRQPSLRAPLTFQHATEIRTRSTQESYSSTAIYLMFSSEDRE